MKKMMIFLGCMSLIWVQAQQVEAVRSRTNETNDLNTRIGINTEKPVASLELSKATHLPATQVQGFMLPHLSQDERNKMDVAALVNGLMIFNTDKNCIDWWNGSHWQCENGSKKDEHAALNLYWAKAAYQGAADFTKECPVGETGSIVNFAPTSPIIGEDSSNISEADAQTKAELKAKAEFDRLGQAVANTLGVCEKPYTVVGCFDDLGNVRGPWQITTASGRFVKAYADRPSKNVLENDPELLDIGQSGDRFIMSYTSETTTEETYYKGRVRGYTSEQTYSTLDMCRRYAYNCTPFKQMVTRYYDTHKFCEIVR